MAGLDFPSSPTNGQIYDDYYYDASTSVWRHSGTKAGLLTRITSLETANATTNKSGLVPIIPSSVSVGAGSASVGASGLITVTSSTSTTLTDIFVQGVYLAYRLVITGSATTNVDLVAQFRTASSTIATTYYGAGWAATYLGSLVISNPRNGGTNGYLGTNGTEGLFIVMDVQTKFLSGTTYKPSYNYTAMNRTNGVAYGGGYGADSIGAYTPSLVISGGTFSGTIQVFGYND